MDRRRRRGRGIGKVGGKGIGKLGGKGGAGVLKGEPGGQKG